MQYRPQIQLAIFTAIVSTFTLMPVTAFAIEWGIGVGMSSTQKAYKNMSPDTKSLPLLYFDNPYVHFFGSEAEIKLPALKFDETQQLKLSLTARYDGSGYKADDADILEGLAKRKGGGVGVEQKQNGQAHG